MSSYFFGGFSAYWIEPSARLRNQSGCSRTHGWSGEHWNAMSRAIWIPWAAAAATRRSNSPNVPRSGWIAVCPPSSPPMAHGEPTTPGPREGALLGPLRRVRPIGWVGGRYRMSNPSPATYGSRCSRRLSVRAQERGQEVGVRALPHGLRGSAERPAVFAGGALGRVFHQIRPRQDLHRDVLPGVDLLLEPRPPRPEPVHPGTEGVPVPAQLLDPEGPLPPVVVDERHGFVVPLALALAAPPELRGQPVVPVGEHVGLHHHGLAHDALGRIPPALDLRGDVLDDDPPASFPDFIRTNRGSP